MERAFFASSIPLNDLREHMTERLDSAYGYLKSKGYSDFGSTGIVGSIGYEVASS